MAPSTYPLPRSAQQAHLVSGYRLDGRYELLFPFAQGGMATVWAARIQGKHGFEKMFAVKTILPHFADDSAFRSMFLEEARIASRIRHPNVASLEDLGEEDGTLYMVLEWISGDSWSRLHDAVAKENRALPLNLLLRMTADACAGLHAAHELTADDGALLGVVHRDVSPQNILVTTSGVTKVIDFGIAKARDRLVEQTQTGMLKGKAEYSAPEQIRMRPVDRRADLWALGTMLYQELAGRLPFEGKDDLATLQRVASGRPPSPLPASVPGPVADIVRRALQSDVSARFANALEMQRALEAAITEAVTAADVSAFVRLHLGERLEKRRIQLAEALREANARPAPAHRGSLPDIGPQPALGDAGAELGGHRPLAALVESMRPPAPAAAPEAPLATVVRSTSAGLEAPVRAVHWVMMIAAVLVTLSVWGVVVYALVRPPAARF